MIKFSEPKALGEPVWALQPQDACFGIENGDNMMYTTTTGLAGIFNVYNLDKRELVFSQPMPKCTKIWKHVMDTKGRIYMAETDYLYRYDPAERKVTNLGKYTETEEFTFTATIDDRDRIYIGTYPNAKVICYDPQANTFTDFGQVDPDASYVRSIAVHKGYIYAGTFGTPPGRLIRISIDNPSERTIFEVPDDVKSCDAKNIQFLYGMNMAGDLLVIYCPMHSERHMLLFDTVKEAFVRDFAFDDEYSGYVTSPLIGNRSYFLSGGRVCYLDTDTAECTVTDIQLDDTLPLFGCDLVELKGYEGFDGISLASIDYKTGGPFFINPVSGKTMRWGDVGLIGGKQPFHTIEVGRDNHLYLPCNGAPHNADYCIETGESEFFSSSEIEGLVEYEGKVYLGAYTGARVLIYDPALPKDDQENPKLIGAVLPDQDRPFAVTAGDGKVFFGTIAAYGTLSGAIGIYDIQAAELTTYYAPVPNQSIMGLAYRDGLLYASTTVYGGLGSKPTEKQAKIFVCDPLKKEKIAEYEPHFQHASQPLYIGGLGFDEKGRLWGASGLTLFEFEPKTGEIIRERNFGDYVYEPNLHKWRQTYIRFDGKGHLFVNLNGIRAVNVEDMSYQTLTDTDTQLYNIGQDGHLYYGFQESSILYQIKIGGETTCQEK